MLGYQNVVPPEAGRLVYAGPTARCIVAKPYNGEAASVSNGDTLGFSAADDDDGRRLARGRPRRRRHDEGAPGPREPRRTTLVGAYLRDPDGNKVCAFNMGH